MTWFDEGHTRHTVEGEVYNVANQLHSGSVRPVDSRCAKEGAIERRRHVG